jgi:hypothetical protein
MASSTKQKRRNTAELAADGFAAVVEKLGIADAVRFVQLRDQGDGDYTSERGRWLDQFGHNEVAELMAKMSRKPPRRQKSSTARGRRA